MEHRTKNVFSVVICCYNPSLEKLKKTILSAESQKNIKIEIIITDDGSSFSYEEQIKNWAKENNFANIVYNFNKVNKGTVSNIISGLLLTKGVYSKVISPGDFFYDNYSLLNYYYCFEKKKADIVFGYACYYLPSGKIIKPLSPICFLTTFRLFTKRNVCLYRDYILGASISAKTELEIYYLKKIEGKVKYTEDFPLSILALLDGKKVICCKKKLIWYEFGTGVSTKTIGKDNSILFNDGEAFYNELSKFPSHFAKKIVRFYECWKINSKPKKAFKYLSISPLYYMFKFFSLFKIPFVSSKKEKKLLENLLGGKHEL